MIKPLKQMAKFYSIGISERRKYMKYTINMIIGGGCLLELINNSTLNLESEVADI